MKALDKKDNAEKIKSSINPKIENFGKQEIFKASQKSKVPVEATMVKDTEHE